MEITKNQIVKTYLAWNQSELMLTPQERAKRDKHIKGLTPLEYAKEQAEAFLKFKTSGNKWSHVK